MTPRIRLVVTDLDNTLYDWVTFFASAFTAMVDVAVRILEVDRERLLDELRTVHRRYHNSEQPFALLETECVREQFRSSEDAVKALNEAFHAFNSVRKRGLRAYPTVVETLSVLRSRGIRVAAHTEATVPNAQFRLSKLGLAPFIERLYALEHVGEPHPAPARQEPIDAVRDVRLINHDERKPDPRVLREISQDIGVPLSETLYVGDSIVRDIGMAKLAGAWAAWAKYGTLFDRKHWEALVRVTHWSAEDVERAKAESARLGATSPDFVLDRFSDILSVCDSYGGGRGGGYERPAGS
jgi:FMN phosphatase YigB (HAD superfamily)